MTGSMAAVALLALLSAGVTASGPLGEEACSGHGSLNATTGLCDCQNPWPNAGESGWTGRNCSVAVWGGTGEQPPHLGRRERRCSACWVPPPLLATPGLRSP